jgi:hypothetical protein
MRVLLVSSLHTIERICQVAEQGYFSSRGGPPLWSKFLVLKTTPLKTCAFD